MIEFINNDFPEISNTDGFRNFQNNQIAEPTNPPTYNIPKIELTLRERKELEDALKETDLLIAKEKDRVIEKEYNEYPKSEDWYLFKKKDKKRNIEIYDLFKYGYKVWELCALYDHPAMAITSIINVAKNAWSNSKIHDQSWTRLIDKSGSLHF